MSNGYVDSEEACHLGMLLEWIQSQDNALKITNLVLQKLQQRIQSAILKFFLEITVQ
jgi:hypothetical protein